MVSNIERGSGSELELDLRLRFAFALGYVSSWMILEGVVFELSCVGEVKGKVGVTVDVDTDVKICFCS